MNNMELTITVIDNGKQPYDITLNAAIKTTYTLGKLQGNDYILESPVVSKNHCRFVYDHGQWMIVDNNSSNGLLYYDNKISCKYLVDGDIIRIDSRERIANGVLFVVSNSSSSANWSMYQLRPDAQYRIGRDESCNIRINNINASRVHALVYFKGNSYYLMDNKSTNGVIINNFPIRGEVQLRERDVIVIPGARFIFSQGVLYTCLFEKRGISVDVQGVVVKRKRKFKSFITSDHVSLNVKPGELVAIIGGSGAGKSTLLNVMCGYLPPNEGNIYINGINLYDNFNSLKKTIGYVPQQDIVYDNLTLTDMLRYAAKLRLPRDISDEEMMGAVDNAISMVDLVEQKNSYIKQLSGGQRKRASIAVELLSNPNLLFLDEPASGLDPGTERSLMHSLREMADNGKTVILVTHSTLQLEMCDKVIFMGKGGRLCYYGSYKNALQYFGIKSIVDVYDHLNNYSEHWQKTYLGICPPFAINHGEAPKSSASSGKSKKQLPVLVSRYFKLVFNDTQRLLLLTFQAPILALLISIVANGNQYDDYSITKSLLFALSCCAFWVGMLNSIQEICKERTILRREYMTGLKLHSYVTSKIIVLGFLGLIQSLVMVGVFSATVGLPEKGVAFHPFAEVFITVFLTALASTAMGLLVSSLFNNADRAMTVAPILLLPQILFSGLIFHLEGVTKVISWFAICRWSMEGFGTTANLNSLDRIVKTGASEMTVPHSHKTYEAFFDYADTHMAATWGILIAFTVGFLLVATLMISSIKREKS